MLPVGKDENGHTGTRQGKKLGKYSTAYLQLYIKYQEKTVGIDSECIPGKEVVGNISTEVVSQIEQEQVYIFYIIRLLLSYEQKKSENSVYVMTA